MVVWQPQEAYGSPEQASKTSSSGAVVFLTHYQVIDEKIRDSIALFTSSEFTVTKKTIQWSCYQCLASNRKRKILRSVRLQIWVVIESNKPDERRFLPHLS